MIKGNYIGSQEYYNNLTDTITGIIIQTILLSFIIPFAIWIYNYRKNRASKYYGISILFGLYNEILDQFALLFDFEKIYPDEHNPFFKYWSKNIKDLKIGFLNSYYYGNLKPKLFCIEHYCNNNNVVTTDLEKLSDIINTIEKLSINFEKVKVIEIKNKRLQMQISMTNTFVFTLCEMTKAIRDKKEKPENLVEVIHNVTIMMMGLFYKYVRFYENYHFYHDLRKEIFNRDYSNQRDIIMTKIYKKEDIEKKRGRFWSELFQLINIIKRLKKEKKLPIYWPFKIIGISIKHLFMSIIKPFKKLKK